MTLRNKTLFITAVTLVALTLILWGISRMVMHAGFSRVEDQDAHRNTVRAVNALQREVLALDTKVHDWAAWDDTYRFIWDRNREYVESNLERDGFATIDINLMLYIDLSGAVVFSRGFDLVTGRPLAIPDSLLHLIAQGDILVRHRDEQSAITGILLMPEGPLIVASRPILTTAEKGPIRGALIFCRYVDRKEITRLSEITQLEITIRSWSDRALPSDFQAAVSSISGKTATLIRPLSSEIIAGYARIDDVHGNPCLILRSAMPRDILYQERHSMLILVIILLATGLGFTSVMLLFLERSVLSRLTRLSREFRGIGTRGDFSGRIGLDGNDELDAVAAAGNRMIEALEEAHNRIRRRNREMSTIMDTAPIALLSLNSEYRLNAEYSKAAEDMFGQKDLAGKYFFDLLGFERDEDRNMLREYLDLLREGSLPEEDMESLNPFPEIRLQHSENDGAIWVKTGYDIIHHEGELRGNILAVFENVSSEHELADHVSRSEAETAQVLAVAENPGLFREFLSLAQDIIHGILEGSALLARDPGDEEIINGLFRLAHTLKGTTSAFGASALSETAKALEDRLSGMREHDEGSEALAGEVFRLAEEFQHEFKRLMVLAERILGDDWQESGEIFLQVSLRELDRVRGMARDLYRDGPKEERAAALVRSLRILRMAPAKKGLARAMRIIEDLLHRTGKEVEFRFEGEETLLDCEVARMLNDPLVHLFRNSLSHGIEEPEERILCGKPERGLVSLIVRTVEEETVLEFTDDGRGMDPGKLLETALRKRMITPEEAEGFSSSDCLELIFLPGFTTSSQVNAIAGRGVGMDAVRENIRLLRGSIRIDPSSAVGVRFIIRIPPMG